MYRAHRRPKPNRRHPHRCRLRLGELHPFRPSSTPTPLRSMHRRVQLPQELLDHGMACPIDLRGLRLHTELHRASTVSRQGSGSSHSVTRVSHGRDRVANLIAAMSQTEQPSKQRVGAGRVCEHLPCRSSRMLLRFRLPSFLRPACSTPRICHLHLLGPCHLM